MASRIRQLDGHIEIVTPENITFQYRVAGPFWRLPAYVIDLCIQGVALAVVCFGILLAFGAAGLTGIGAGFAMMVFFLVSWFYGGVFETFWNGQTPGKRMMRLRVVTLDGQPINALQAILRNVLRVADALPALAMTPIPLYMVGLLTMSLNDRFQRLGDLACGTMVIIEEPHYMQGLTRMEEPEVIALAASLPPGFVASHGLARALSKYVGRRAGFAPARRAEIARHLGQPLAERFNLPPQTNHDLLLCAMYYRTFINDRPTEPNLVLAEPVVMAKLSPAEEFAHAARTAEVVPSQYPL